MYSILLVSTPNVIPSNWEQCDCNGEIVTYDPEFFQVRTVALGEYNGLFCTRSEGLIPQPVGLTDYSYMFGRLELLKTVDMTGWDFSGVRSVEGLFMGCENLRNVKGDLCDFSKCNSFKRMFASCTSLKNIRLNFCNTGSVKTCEEMFIECSRMEDCSIDSWDTENLINTEGMFQDCTSLIELDIHDWKASSIENMNRMFKHCSSLVEVNIGFDSASNLRKAIQIFYGCGALLKVITPAGEHGEIRADMALDGTPPGLQVKQYFVDKSKPPVRGLNPLLGAISSMSGD